MNLRLLRGFWRLLVITSLAEVCVIRAWAGPPDIGFDRTSTNPPLPPTTTFTWTITSGTYTIYSFEIQGAELGSGVMELENIKPSDDWEWKGDISKGKYSWKVKPGKPGIQGTLTFGTKLDGAWDAEVQDKTRVWWDDVDGTWWEFTPPTKPDGTWDYSQPGWGALTPVPEPGSLLALGGGLVSLGGMALRRRR